LVQVEVFLDLRRVESREAEDRGRGPELNRRIISKALLVPRMMAS